MNFKRTHIALCISSIGAFWFLPNDAFAGGTEARAHVVGTTVTALAVGPYSAAEIDIAVSRQGQRHQAKVVAPILAVAIGAGRSSKVSVASSPRKTSSVAVVHPVISVAVFRNTRTTID